MCLVKMVLDHTLNKVYWINFKPVRRSLALPYYLYCLRLRRLVLI